MIKEVEIMTKEQGRTNSRILSISLDKTWYQHAKEEAAENQLSNITKRTHLPVSISAIINDMFRLRYRSKKIK